jgi:hypothetical protein
MQNKPKSSIPINFQYFLFNKDKINANINKIIFKYQQNCFTDYVFV